MLLAPEYLGFGIAQSYTYIVKMVSIARDKRGVFSSCRLKISRTQGTSLRCRYPQADGITVTTHWSSVERLKIRGRGKSLFEKRRNIGVNVVNCMC